MSGLLNRAVEIYREARNLGISFTRASLAGRRKHGETIVRVGKYGDFTIRRENTDLATLRQVFLDAQYALPDAVQKRVRKRYDDIVSGGETPIIVDAGANIGAATIWFKHLYPLAAIAAIEPVPESAAIARKNVGSWSDATVLEAAIGSRTGFASVLTGPDSWASRTTRSDAGQPIVTVNDAAECAGPGRLFLVKIDIEGFESDLFSENLDWLKDVYVVYIEPHDWMLTGKHTSRSFQRAMADHDFELFLVGENLAYVKL